MPLKEATEIGIESWGVNVAGGQMVGAGGLG